LYLCIWVCACLYINVCLLGKFLLILASTVILGSESCGTHDHI
jgi:hypothetical protein